MTLAPPSSSPFLRSASVSLTNAQVIALPTTAQTIVSSPGGTLIIVPAFGLAFLDWTADYTGINAGALVTFLPTGGVGFSAALSEAAGGGVSSLLAVGQDAIATFTFQQVESASVTRSSGGYDPVTAGGALRIWASNGGGNFTGGNAANVLRVSVAYGLFDTSSGAFI